MTQFERNANNANRKSNSRRASGISWRLFGALAVFVTVILLVFWAFQVLLLGRFYESMRMDSFESVSESVKPHLGTRGIRERVYDLSTEHGMCIRVFEIEGENAKEIASADVNTNCTIHNVTGEGLSQLYLNAHENGGLYTKKIGGGEEGEHALTSVYIKMLNGTDGREYVVMLDAEIETIAPMTRVLERQFGWIASILIMGSLIMAFAMSRVVCKPMERMSRSAHRLAQGDYDVVFEGGGYRESAELADALNYATEELAKQDVLQKELLANISHDLRTPLTMIKGYSEVMRDIPGESSPENFQVIIDETERLSSLVNDLLDLSRIRSGARKPEAETFNITKEVRSILKRYEKLTERDDYSITFEATEDVCVTADRVMIGQVVYNLVNNAINYTGEDKRINIVQSAVGNTVRISVSDTGEGISDADLPYIWDRYYKVDKVHKRAKVGTGIGLSIVKSVLEAHGASFGVESEVGEGSTFYFELDVTAFCGDTPQISDGSET